jgi:Ca2+-binding RTX toxin-like protein
MASFTGTSGDDHLIGHGQADTFDISQGGADTVEGAGGDDRINAGGALSTDDRLMGGAGFDVVTLDGDYSAGVTLTAQTLDHIDQLSFAEGHDYSLTFDDGDYQVDVNTTLVLNAGDYYTEQTLHLDASAVTTIGFFVDTGLGDDWLKGTQRDDDFILWGGKDTVSGGGGADWFELKDRPGRAEIDGGGGDDTVDTTMRAFDKRALFNGGDGFDTVMLGDSPATLVLSGATFQGVESIQLNGGSRHVELLNDLADASLSGDYLEVSAAGFFDIDVEIDGSRERDTSLHLVSGGGDDLLIGGLADDVLDIRGVQDGNDTAQGGRGDDTIITRGSQISGKDVIDGGAGLDVLRIEMGGSARLTGVTNVETVVLTDVSTLTLVDGNVGAGRIMTVDATAIEETFDTTVVNGAAESDGKLKLLGSGFHDSLVGGAGADTLQGNAGADTLTGGGGADRFVYTSIEDSRADASDSIRDLANADTIDLRLIDADSEKAGNQAFKLVDHFTGKAGQAVLSYDSAHGKTLLSLDVDGDGHADGIIQMTGNHSSFDNIVL